MDELSVGWVAEDASVTPDDNVRRGSERLGTTTTWIKLPSALNYLWHFSVIKGSGEPCLIHLAQFL